MDGQKLNSRQAPAWQGLEMFLGCSLGKGGDKQQKKKTLALVCVSGQWEDGAVGKL